MNLEMEGGPIQNGITLVTLMSVKVLHQAPLPVMMHQASHIPELFHMLQTCLLSALKMMAQQLPRMLQEQTTDFPSSVIVTLTLMDRFSYIKWQVLDGAGASNKDLFKADNSYTFRKTFFLGEKGQND